MKRKRQAEVFEVERPPRLQAYIDRIDQAHSEWTTEQTEREGVNALTTLFKRYGDTKGYLIINHQREEGLKQMSRFLCVAYKVGLERCRGMYPA